MGEHRPFWLPCCSRGIEKPCQVVSFDIYINKVWRLPFEQCLITDHSFQRLGNANVMLDSGHLILEGVEGISEVIAQNNCHGFRVIDDESCIL